VWMLVGAGRVLSVSYKLVHTFEPANLIFHSEHCSSNAIILCHGREPRERLKLSPSFWQQGFVS
jgi:hypothetical protein